MNKSDHILDKTALCNHLDRPDRFPVPFVTFDGDVNGNLICLHSDPKDIRKYDRYTVDEATELRDRIGELIAGATINGVRLLTPVTEQYNLLTDAVARVVSRRTIAEATRYLLDTVAEDLTQWAELPDYFRVESGGGIDDSLLTGHLTRGGYIKAGTGCYFMVSNVDWGYHPDAVTTDALNNHIRDLVEFLGDLGRLIKPKK